MVILDKEKKKEYKTKVQTILEELKTTDINLGNYRKYQDKLEGTEQIVLAQIENTLTDYQEMSAEFNDETKKQSFKDNYDGGIVDRKIYDLLVRIVRNSKETFSWQTLQLELTATMLKRMIDIVGDSQAYEIKRDSLKEMRDDSKRIIDLALNMQSQNNDLLQATLNGRIQYIEDRMTAFMENSINKINTERNQMYDLLKSVVKNLKEQKTSTYISELPEPLTPMKTTKEEIINEISPLVEEARAKMKELEQELQESLKKNKDLQQQILKREEKIEEMETKGVVPRKPVIKARRLEDDDDDMDEMDNNLKELEDDDMNDEGKGW